MHSKVNRVSIYIMLVVASLIQLILLNRLTLAGTKPDLLVMLVVFFSIFFGPGIGLETGFVSGLFKDIYSLDMFGVNTLTLSLTGFIAGIVSPKFFRESKPAQAMLVFAFSVLSMLIHYFASRLMSRITYVSLPEYFFALFLPSSIYTAAASALIFPSLIKICHLKKNEEYL